MEAEIKGMIRRQYGAALTMLRDAIEQCPEELWDDRSEGPPFWQLAYHALFYCDLYVSESLETYRPPACHVEHAQFFAGEYPRFRPPLTVGPPAFVIGKADLFAFVERCLAHCAEAIDTMTPEQAAARCGFWWYPLSVAELQLVSLRHVQHHVGQLAQRLRRRANVGVAWVGSVNVV